MNHHQKILDMLNRITYYLKRDKLHEIITKAYQTETLTNYKFIINITEQTQNSGPELPSVSIYVLVLYILFLSNKTYSL